MKKYKRILLKLSGEALMGEQKYGIDSATLGSYALQVHEIAQTGVEIGIVIGGGNIFRGVSGLSKGFDRVKGDYMGMLATVINGLALQSAIEAAGTPSRVLTAVRMEHFAEFYSKTTAMEALAKKQVVIFTAGTGNPFFTTDTAATLRAIEIGASMIIKATKVDGVYDKDPKKYPDATKLFELTYDRALDDSVKVMDDTSIALAKDNNLPIVVCNMFEKGNLLKIIQGDLSDCSIVRK